MYGIIGIIVSIAFFITICISLLSPKMSRFYLRMLCGREPRPPEKWGLNVFNLWDWVGSGFKKDYKADPADFFYSIMLIVLFSALAAPLCIILWPLLFIIYFLYYYYNKKSNENNED